MSLPTGLRGRYVDNNIVIFGCEIQHKLVSEIGTQQTPAAELPRRYWTHCESILRRFPIRSLCYELRRLVTPFQQPRQEAILELAGFGLNIQNSYNNPNAHPNYNAFGITVT